jgi:hypothetical protein
MTQLFHNSKLMWTVFQKLFRYRLSRNFIFNVLNLRYFIFNFFLFIFLFKNIWISVEVRRADNMTWLEVFYCNHYRAGIWANWLRFNSFYQVMTMLIQSACRLGICLLCSIRWLKRYSHFFFHFLIVGEAYARNKCFCGRCLIVVCWKVIGLCVEIFSSIFR